MRMRLHCLLRLDDNKSAGISQQTSCNLSAIHLLDATNFNLIKSTGLIQLVDKLVSSRESSHFA